MATTQDTPEVKYYDLTKLSLWTNTPGVEGKRARMAFGLRDGNPRITVFTNDPSDEINKGVIQAAMNPETFATFIRLMEGVIKSKDVITNKIECYGSRWEGDKIVERRVLNSEVFFGRDADGIIWISVVAEHRPKIRFDFKISQWHGIYIDGKQIDEAQASSLEAASKITLLSKMVDHFLAESVTHSTARGKQPNAPRKQPVQQTSFDSAPAKTTSASDIFGEDVPF